VRELVLGISIGFGAGISPGPLLTLVIATALRSGFLAGARVAGSPLITDGPIILISVVLLTSLPDPIQTAISAAGALFVIYLGIHTMRDSRNARFGSTDTNLARQDVIKGALVNLLSPHPWLFWIGVGAPILTTAWEKSAVNASAFVIGFYLLLIGSKIGLAALTAAGRSRLTVERYRQILLVAGVLLVADGILLLWTAR